MRLRLHHGNHLVPLRRGDVIAGGVVAAGVQHARWCRARRRSGWPACRRSCAAPLARRSTRRYRPVKTGVGEQARWFSSGVGDQHLGVGADLLREVGTDLRAASAADGLHGGHAAGLHGFAVGAEHQALDGCHRRRCRRWAGSHGRWAFPSWSFQRPARTAARQLAVVVEINADAQVDLVGVGVGVELFVQTQDGVAGAISTAVNRDMKILERLSVAKNPGVVYCAGFRRF